MFFAKSMNDDFNVYKHVDIKLCLKGESIMKKLKLVEVCV